jgi:hypothetical protein
MDRAHAGTANITDVRLLRSIKQQLLDDFMTLPVELQQKARPAFDKLQEHLTSVAIKLERALQTGTMFDAQEGQQNRELKRKIQKNGD